MQTLIKKLFLIFLLTTVAYGANDFSSDGALIGLWNCEDGALGTDSSGNGETLTVSAVVSDEVNFRQGLASAYANVVTDTMFRANADLSADFPGKNGTANRTFTVCGWVKPIDLPQPNNFIASIYNTPLTRRSWAAVISESGKATILIGYSSGALYETLTHAGKTLATGSWYHIGFTYDGASRDWRIRVKDYTADTHTESTGTGDQTMNISSAIFNLFGRQGGLGGMIGNIDELVIFNDVKTANEIDEIADGTYGGAPAATGQVIIIDME